MKKRFMSFCTAVAMLISFFSISSVVHAASDIKPGTYLVTEKHGMPMYAEPNDESDVLTTVPKGTYITVINALDKFAYAVFDSVFGWLDMTDGTKFIDKKPSVTDTGIMQGVKSITVTHLPDKLVYVEGEEKADITGLEVSVIFNDADNSRMPVDDYIVSFPTLDVYGKKTVDIYYGGFRTSFNITVVKVPVTSISITMPEKTTYIEGEPISFKGLEVTAYYSDGRDGGKGIKLSPDDYTITGLEEGDRSLLPGSYKVTVTYKYPEISSSFHVYVSGKKVVSLKIIKAPAELSLYKGQSFNTKDFLLRATFDNGTTADISDFDIEYDSMNVGTFTARICYMGKYVAFDYEVYEVYETGIALGDTTAVGSYMSNELDFSELHVYLVYNSGEKREVYDYELEYDIDIFTDGKYPVKVTYDGYSATFDYTVAKRIERLIGDVNNDTFVKIDDARLTLRYAVKLEQLSEDDIAAADVDHDGKVTPADARKIMRVALKLEVF